MNQYNNEYSDLYNDDISIKQAVKNKHFEKLWTKSPVVYCYIAICVAVYIVDTITFHGLVNNVLGLGGTPRLVPVLNYTCITYIFCHSGLTHIVSNLLILGFVGPPVERKYGSLRYAIMILLTAFITAEFNSILFETGIVGASGIVYMTIMLGAFAFGNAFGSIKIKDKIKIPITAIIALVFYVGSEMLDSLTQFDNISHFGHIFGALCGFTFALILRKNNKI